MKPSGLGLVLLRSSLAILVFTLWVQWPMRMLLIGDARFINDIGQIAFAFFVVIAFNDANRTQSHLSIHSQHKPEIRTHFWMQWIKYFFLTAWAVFVAYSAFPLFIHSLKEAEKFPDSYTPGYFLLKLALLILPLSYIAFLIKQFIQATRDKH